MCVTAHPDDESGGFGGTLKLCHDRGVETFVLCLTAGQAASHRGGAQTDEELAALRRKEFGDACAILGVTRGEVLDYPDGRLDCAGPDAVVRDVTRRMREFRPQVVLTFAGDGGVTAHRDHAMAGVFATLAFQWAGRPDRFPEQFSEGLKPHRAQKLYYLTAPFTIADRSPIAPAPITAEIDVSAQLETRLAAFHAHTTQTPLFPVFAGIVKNYGSKDVFHLAACTHPGPIRHETDLFSGVRDED